MAGRVYDCVKLRTLTYCAKHGHLRTVLNSLRAASVFRSSAGNGRSSLWLFKLRTLTYCAKQLVFELLLFSDPVQAIACRVYDCVKLQTLTYWAKQTHLRTTSTLQIKSRQMACRVYDRVKLQTLTYWAQQRRVFGLLLPFRSNAGNGMWSLWLCKETYCGERDLLHIVTFRWSSLFYYLQIKCSQWPVEFMTV